MRRTTRRGFTIIELLIVMAILLVLISLVVVGSRVLQNSGKTNQTKAMQQSMLGITNELKLKLPNSPLFAAANTESGPMLSPGNVTSDGGQGNRTGATAVLATASVMVQAQAIPDCQTAINAFQPVQLMSFNYPGGSTPAGRICVWAANAPYRAGMDLVEEIDMTQTPPVDRVFVCALTPPGKPAVDPLTDGSPDWSPASFPLNIHLTTRLPLDGWGNPMIFVPASGLAGVLLSDGNYHTIVSPDGQPFWASAGPDGDFSHGDDNIYSFNK